MYNNIRIRTNVHYFNEKSKKHGRKKEKEILLIPDDGSDYPRSFENARKKPKSPHRRRKKKERREKI